MLSGGVVTVVAATPHRGTEKTGSTAACLSLRNYLARTTNQTWPLSEALQNDWLALFRVRYTAKTFKQTPHLLAALPTLHIATSVHQTLVHRVQ